MNERKLKELVENTPGSVELLNALLYRLDKSAKRVLNTKEACEYLGCSSTHLRELCHARKIARCKPAATPNGKSARVYFLRDDLDAYMTMNRIPSIYEVEQKASDYMLSRIK